MATVIGADTTETTDGQVRNARHAYLANVSYVDDQIGALTDTLDRLDQQRDTVVIFTSDHGDMLGERGLWYKMNFFENSARIPLVISCPGRFEPGRVRSHTSLLDVAPTLLELGRCAPMNHVDGGSVLPLVEHEDPKRTVLGEYLGEGAVGPVVMIRRGHEKFVWCSADPPQLYDVTADPHELDNLALDADRAADVATYGREVHATWDTGAIEAQVRASQRARRLVDRALRTGHHHPWDHQPHTDAAQQFMRNHLDLNDVEASRRL
ncbi:MAG: sulfatase-like hydrolase/transferase [Actinomycetota bacterium]|nr:sulfatase-like hydrolase/transferase [Actinomycetota bacterium]